MCRTWGKSSADSDRAPDALRAPPCGHSGADEVSSLKLFWRDLAGAGEGKRAVRVCRQPQPSDVAACRPRCSHLGRAQRVPRWVPRARGRRHRPPAEAGADECRTARASIGAAPSARRGPAGTDPAPVRRRAEARATERGAAAARGGTLDRGTAAEARGPPGIDCSATGGRCRHEGSDAAQRRRDEADEHRDPCPRRGALTGAAGVPYPRAAPPGPP